MHREAYRFVRKCVERYGPFDRVLEVGSRIVIRDGELRPAFNWFKGSPHALIIRGPSLYVGVDAKPGPGVDFVFDWVEEGRCRLPWGARFDCVVSCEMLEHCCRPEEAVRHMIEHLTEEQEGDKRGILIITCAGPTRKPHGCEGQSELPEGEHYQNINPDELRTWLKEMNIQGPENGTDLWLQSVGGDIQVCGRKP